MTIPPALNPFERTAAQLAIAIIDRDETAARALLLTSHQEAADAALALGNWLIGCLEYGGTTREQFRADLAGGLRPGMMSPPGQGKAPADAAAPVPDDDDTARELIGSAGLPPDMPRILSDEESENAVRWIQALSSHVVSGHLFVRADSDEVAHTIISQVREVDVMARGYLYHGADRTIRPGEEFTTEIISQSDMADVMVRQWLRELDPEGGA
jgi:hypothetical protein